MGLSLSGCLFEATEDGETEAQHLPVVEGYSQSSAVAIAANGKKGVHEKPPTAKGQRAKLEANGYRCALSGVTLTPEILSIEHLQPLTRGGSHTEDNVAIVHKIVNRMKGELTQSEFIDWCCLVADYARLNRA